MASGNRCREAYTAGGEATLLSFEILNVDAFVLIIGTIPIGVPHAVGASPFAGAGVAAVKQAKAEIPTAPLPRRRWHPRRADGGVKPDR